MTVYRATCVAIGDRGVLIEGLPHSGKSTLALMLLDRGARLVGDDGVLIAAQGAALVARPHPNTRGLLEVRNLGLVRMPVLEEVAIRLVIRLDPDAARFIEAAQSVEIEGVALPLVRLWPNEPANALKVEMALERFGTGA